MSFSYTKLFSSITESTVWSEPLAVRVVWVTMLAMVDRYGRVWGSVPGLARRANVTLEECQQALKCFLSPDPHSRTPDHDGRRVEPIDGGWRLLNYDKYREMQDEEAQKERNAERQRRFRERQKASDVPHETVTPRNESNADVTKVTGNNPIASAAVDATAVNQKKKDLAAAARPPFANFWGLWPKRVAKAAAEKAWGRVNPSEVPAILAAVERQARSADWTKERGKFIPHPATWLNGRRWEDEQGATPSNTPRTFSAAELEQ